MYTNEQCFNNNAIGLGFLFNAYKIYMRLIIFLTKYTSHLRKLNL